MKNRIFLAFAEKSFLFLWLSEIFTILAFNLFNFYILLRVYDLTKSNLAVSLAVISFTLPAILFGVLAGVYVDRLNKKYVLFVANILRGVFVFALALYPENLLVLYTTSFLVALVTQFFIPAETPMIPLLVRKELLFSANALFGLGLYGSALLAYLLSGPILLFLGGVQTLILLGLMFLISSIFITGIHIEKKRGKKRLGLLQVPKSALLAEVRQAIKIMRNSRPIYNSLFLLTLSQILLLVLAVIAPGYSTQILKISIEKFPLYFIAPAAFGVLVGAIILVTVLHDKSKEKLTTIGLFLSGIAMLVLPYGSKITAREIVQTLNESLPHVLDLTPLHLVVAMAFILGLANAFIFVPSNTILQEKTTDEFRGKIYGVLNAMVGIFSLVPIMIAGGLSDFFGVDKVIVGVGVTLLGLGFGRLLFKF
jgi:MFS family permease